MKLFFNYSIDCELPPNTRYTQGTERRPFFHGPPMWEFAEASVRGFVEQMDSLGLRDGATLFVYPDVATHQRSLYRHLADSGVEPLLSTPDEFTAFIRSEMQRYAKVVKDAGIKAQ